MNRTLNFTSLALACIVGLTSTASAQELITWEESEQMFPGETAQTFVNTAGTPAFAANMDSRADSQNTTVTLNGVDFASTDVGNLSSVTGPTGITMSTTIAGETGAPFGDGSFNADGDIFNVIATGIFGPGDVTLSGLTAGRIYEIQIFVNDARNNRSVNFLALFSDGVNPFDP